MNSLETELKNLRNHLALKHNIAPYSIFKDDEMERLLKVKPKTIDELCKIKGFPRNGVRVTKWGNQIVNVFRLKGSPSGSTSKLSV